MPLSPSHTDWSITSHFEDDDADLLGESQNPHRPLPAEIPDSQPDSPDTPREIADSQDDLLDIDLPDADPIDESSSFHTTATEIIFGGTKLTPKLEPRYVSLQYLFIYLIKMPWEDALDFEAKHQILLIACFRAFV